MKKRKEVGRNNERNINMTLVLNSSELWQKDRRRNETKKVEQKEKK